MRLERAASNKSGLGLRNRPNLQRYGERRVIRRSPRAHRVFLSTRHGFSQEAFALVRACRAGRPSLPLSLAVSTSLSPLGASTSASSAAIACCSLLSPRRSRQPPRSLKGLEMARDNLQALPVGNRPERTKPADARMGGARVDAWTVPALRKPSPRRLRRLHIVHERAARRSGGGTERAPQAVRAGARTRLRFA